MKKLKLNGKEVKQLGFTIDHDISIAIKIVAKNYMKDEKTVALAHLENVLSDPGKFEKDEIFSELAHSLLKHKIHPSEPSKKKIDFKKKITDYKIYGLEGIDPETLNQMATAMKLPIVVKGALMADAHVGYGLPIGGVVAAYNAVMPYGVGMDIGCRMCLSVYQESPNLDKPEKTNDKKQNSNNFEILKFKTQIQDR